MCFETCSHLQHPSDKQLVSTGVTSWKKVLCLHLKRKSATMDKPRTRAMRDHSTKSTSSTSKQKSNTAENQVLRPIKCLRNASQRDPAEDNTENCPLTTTSQMSKTMVDQVNADLQKQLAKALGRSHCRITCRS